MPDLIIPPRFKKVLDRKPAKLKAAIVECLQRLANNPRHPALQTHRVQGVPGVYEAYVDKANRVTFEWDGPAIRLRHNCNHDILKRSP